MPLFEKYASVILDLSIDKTLEYGVPPGFADELKPGMRVEVPLRGQPRQGYIFSIQESPSFPKVAPLSKLLSTEELITQELFNLALWMAKYYNAPLRQVFKALVPSSVRSDINHKTQYFVRRKETREKLKIACEKLRLRYPAQAALLDILLKVKKGIFLTELLERAGATKSPATTLERKGLITIEKVTVDRSPLSEAEYFRTHPKKLTGQQSTALEAISQSIEKEEYQTHLLYGVTGSGKTEVYLQAIEKALALGKETIMLVPEISLTAQTIQRFRSRFSEYIAILHHRLSAGERYDEWHKIRRGEASIVIGARSAIFSPLPNLGLIIVDEEHEPSYKQTEESPTYHARDIAVMRGFLTKSCVILGSATPCLESYHNASSGKYSLLTLSERPTAAQLPDVTIVDMQREDEKAKRMTTFSDLLLKKIEERLSNGEQTMLFLNRRGYHASMLCKKCQQPIKCGHCDLAMTFHYNDNQLSCHLCGFSHTPPPQQCPHCKEGSTMKFRGIGTEQVERALHAIFPKLRTIRVDADTTRHKGSHEKLFHDFRTGKADLMIGTQMIAKGLHFPQVTLVGVLNSDASLNIPDFRSSERIFQLLTQVAGRSGRGDLKGEVIIQTRMPQNRTIELASQQDYLSFFQEELEVRRAFGYPPFSNLAKFTLTGKNEKETQQMAEEIHRSLLQQLPSNYLVAPVAPSGYAKIKDRFRFQFFVKGASIYLLNEKIIAMRNKLFIPKKFRLSIDIDPLALFF